MVDGSTMVEREYFDPETKTMVKINMSVSDHLLHQTLQDIKDAIRGIKIK